MAAALDTMSMTLSPGLDALKGSPLSGSTDSLHLGDYLDLGAPSSSSSPRPSHAPSPRITRSSANVATAGSSSSTHVAPSKALVSPTTAAPLPTSESVAPPPPGSSPEAVFRFYLKIELRKMGSPADDSIIDKYVQQHYSTFIKAMENGKAIPTPPGAPAGPASSSSAPKLNKMPVATTVKVASAPEQNENNAASAATNITPLSSMSPQSQPQPFKVPLAADAGAANMFDVETSQQPLYDSIDPHYVQFGGSPASHFTGIKRESDAMSEDGGEGMDTLEEDSKDDLAPLISDLRFSGGRGGSDGSYRYGSEAGSSRGSEEPAGGVPLSIRDSAAADLRPTAEEYRALSSKEKRQLRNKISARNFRERRKEYITHLESKISSRDTIIDSLRAQLSAASLQNKKLEDEVKTLQARSLSQNDVQKILEALQNVTSTASASYPANSPLVAESHTWPQHQGALRSSAANDLTLSSAGALGGSSRPSTPSSPRPSMVRRGSPSLGSSGQLPQHNPRKDIAVGSSAKGSSSSSGSGFWKGGPTVAASA